MNLKAYILGNTYNLVQGNTFADEYNETLDSGTIIINGVAKIDDLRPYDDVFIWDSDGATQFTGYGDNATLPSVYYHLLVDQFSCEQLILGENNYKYTIQLFSETKGLETIQLPNISITQPLDASDKETTYNYMYVYVAMYNSLYKKVYNSTNKTYEYARKYSLATSNYNSILLAPSNVFGDNDYAPEMTLNNPNLRDVLAQLMLTKDCIPVVKDDKIYAMDISKRNGTFDTSKGEINYVIGSRSSSNHCDNLKRTYQNALGQENTCRYTEYLGFRNSDTGLLTLSNMRLETKFPIYKINKILMCYYKKIRVATTVEWTNNTNYVRGDVCTTTSGGVAYVCILAHNSSGIPLTNTTYWQPYYVIFLCKQDITPLVLLNSYRNALSLDYDDIQSPSSSSVTDVDDLAKYKFCTVGYDIGDKNITGWGTTYSQINSSLSWFNHQKTYIENILLNMDIMYPFGIYGYGYVSSLLNENESLSLITQKSDVLPNIVVGDTYWGQDVVKIKSLMFEIEYDGFYNGTIIHSKDGARDNIVMNDNESSSLTLLEKDGLFQKEKANRFGNEAIQINARYTDIDDLQPLGCVYGDDDVVIYHREYSIYDKVINCTYYGTKDYVLKNYYTSVYSKHRPFNMLSYGESTRRSENRKRFILLSKNKCFYQQNIYPENAMITTPSYTSNGIRYKTFDTANFSDYFGTIVKMASALDENAKAETKGVFNDTDIINSAYINASGIYNKTDLNSFVCGKSMCFNLTMYDNLGNGSSIKQIVPTNLEDLYSDSGLGSLKLLFSNVQDDYTGSTQFYNNLYNRDNTTGRLDLVTFAVCHKEDTYVYEKEATIGAEDEVLENIDGVYRNGAYDSSNQISDTNVALYKFGTYRLPNVRSNWNTYATNILYSGVGIKKDNKEQLDMTFQIEPITNDSDIYFSEWFMKLNNLISRYHKTDNTYSVYDVNTYSKQIQVIYGAEEYATTTLFKAKKYIPYVLLRIKTSDFSSFSANDNLVGEFNFGRTRVNDFFKYGFTIHTPFLAYLLMSVNKIVSINTSKIVLNVSRKYGGSIGVFNTAYMNESDTYNLEFNIISDTTSKGYANGYYTFAWNFRDNTTAFSPPVDNTTFTMGGTAYTINQSDGYYLCYHNIDEYLPIGSTGLSIGENCSQTFLFLSSESYTQTTYNKNMFVALSTNELKDGDEYKAYTSSSDIDGFSSTENVSYRFNVCDEDIISTNVSYNRPLILVNLQDLSSDIRSVSYYFYDEDNTTYHFVFGVNVTEEDIANGYIKIYLSGLNTRDTRVFDANHLIVGYEKNYADTTSSFPTADVKGYYE